MPGNEYVAQKLGKEDKLTHTMYFCSGYEGESILKKWLVDNGYSEHTSVNPFIALSQVLLMYANNPEHAFQGWNQVAGHKGGTLEKSYQDMIIKAYDYINTFVFELVNTANGEATFQSEITRWNNLSYATVMISRINKEK